MNSFGLIRIKLSNEYIMAILFTSILMFLIPYWIDNPKEITVFLSVLIIGLILDAIMNFRKIHKLRCSVSASITVGIMFLLYPHVSFLLGLVGVVCGLIIGKLMFHTTGKNILNPAMVGIVVLSIFYDGSSSMVIDHIGTFVVLMITIPFVLFRPYAAIGLGIGVINAMFLKETLNIDSLLTISLPFWCCLIITDPVTISERPFIGIASAILGFLAFWFYDSSIISMAILILTLNLLSYVIESIYPKYEGKCKKRTKIISPYIKTIYPVDTTDFRLGYVNEYSSPFESDSIIPSMDNLTKETILRRIKVNNVRGLGGAGFPTYQKLKSLIDSPIEDKYIIINAVECDPGLIHDKWILTQYPNEIEAGAELLIKLTGINNILLATKQNTSTNFSNIFGKLEVIRIADYYPLGGEKLLIKEVLGKTFHPSDIPSKNGVLVLNVQTILSIYEAVLYNRPVISKYITFGNLLTKEATILRVSIDTKISDIIESSKNENHGIFVGGGIMQSKIVTSNDVIDYNTNFIALSEHPRYKNSYCSKCGICEKRCPMGLKIQSIVNLVEDNRLEEIQKYHPEC